MTTLLALVLACTTATSVVASETPLPQGAEQLAQELQSFGTLRVWIHDGDYLANAHNLTDDYVVSIRADGTVVIDVAGQHTRFRWTASSVSQDETRRIPTTSLDDPRWSPAPMSPWAHTVPLVQQAVQALRSQDLAFLARGPAYYGRMKQGFLNSLYAEIAPPAPLAGTIPGHLFAVFTREGLLHKVVFYPADRGSRTLVIKRLEFDPPLPATWFDADAPELDFRFPSFVEGEPDPPLDPGFYAPVGQPPPPSGGGGPPPPPPPPPP